MATRLIDDEYQFGVCGRALQVASDLGHEHRMVHCRRYNTQDIFPEGSEVILARVATETAATN